MRAELALKVTVQQCYREPGHCMFCLVFVHRRSWPQERGKPTTPSHGGSVSLNSLLW